MQMGYIDNILDYENEMYSTLFPLRLRVTFLFLVEML